MLSHADHGSSTHAQSDTIKKFLELEGLRSKRWQYQRTQLLTQWKINSGVMEMEFDDNHFVDFASKLDKWEMLAKSLKIPNSEIESIKNEGGMQLQRIKMLESWKQRCGSKATYRAMIEALLQINRTDLAESVITSVRSAGKDKTNKHISILRQANVVVPPSPSSSSETEDIPTPSTLTPSRTTVTQNVLPSRAQNGHMILTLRELEKEFYDLIVFAEVALKNNKVHLDTITRRFSMLPQSIKQQYQMDDSYSATRQRILNSTTIKELFDNLTELKHWNYMMPETLAYILQDVKIDDVHQKIEKYTSKLAMFKANTKLRDLIGISFPVPDYCIELTMITEGWEDKTISDVERSTMNILRRATYNGHNIPIEWKAVNPGSIELVFILMKPITSDFYSRMEILHDICKDSGVRIVQVDGCVLYDHQYSKVNFT